MGWFLRLLLLLGAQGRCQRADLGTPDLPVQTLGSQCGLVAAAQGGGVDWGGVGVKGRLHMVRRGKDLILSILQLPLHTGSLFFLPLISILLCTYSVVLDSVILALNINEWHYGSKE